MNETDKLMLVTGRTVTDAEWDYAESIDAVNDAIKKQNEQQAEQAAHRQLVAEAMQIGTELLDMEMESIRENTQERIDLVQLEIDEIHRRRDEELGALRETTAYKLASGKKKKEMEKKVVDDHIKQEKAKKAAQDALRAQAKDDMRKMFKFQQGINISESVMNTAQSYTAALKMGPILGIPMATIVAALGAVQVAMIAAQSPPSFQYGGLVGGQRHNQGGTMIEAERGEFIMSRGAVEAAGIETMNKINRGGGASNISISFAGNVLSKDFIEDEAIPQIKEAIRRGADIGIG